MGYKIYAWINYLRDRYKIYRSDIVSPVAIVADQLCTKDQATRKRVANAFQQQAQSISARAMKVHSCNDPLSCVVDCFVFVPDKIASDPVEVSVADLLRDRKITALERKARSSRPKMGILDRE